MEENREVIYAKLCFVYAFSKPAFISEKKKHVKSYIRIDSKAMFTVYRLEKLSNTDIGYEQQGH